EKAREVLGRDFIIGATAHNLDEAKRALLLGADYLGVGAAFGSDTKKDAKPMMNLESYREITSNIPIPVVAIGGITAENLHHLKGLGLSGIAVISSIFGAFDIKENTKGLKQKAKEEILK
ncbi:MAG: thiamine phosphate synthase, partial [Butyrivibrio sp.]|nr:thiamine phosphate synthase [Butyrivibrio sp.]